MIIPTDPQKLASMTDEEVIEAYESIGFDRKTAEAFTKVLRNGEGADLETKLPTSSFLSIESATELAKSVGHEELLAELEKSARHSVGFVKLAEGENGEVILSAPKGVMVAIFLDRGYPELTVQGGVTDPHITLCYLGESDELSASDVRKLLGVVAEVAARHSWLRGVVKGTGYFVESGAWWAEPHVPGLFELRESLAAELRAAGLPVAQDYDFTPHITLAYTDDPPAVDVAPFELTVSRLTVAMGSFRYDIDLPEPNWSSESWGEPLVNYSDSHTTPFVPIVKSAEKRFTLAPMYIPGQLDAHGDWSTPEELQEALWKFQRGDKLIAVQHHPELGSVGEAVEMMVVPWEHTVPMYKADGTSSEVTFPAGTPWLGVIWEPEVWDAVKEGKMRGYSIGGTASLLNVGLPEEA